MHACLNALLTCAASFAASVVFMGDTVVAERRMLAVFPVCLFYVVMAWMVYVQ